MAIATQAIDEARLMKVLGRVVDDFGAIGSATLVLIGERLGLYRALAEAGPLAPAELADRTGTGEHYVRPWLINQAAAGYVDYDPGDGRFSLSPEQQAALVDESSPWNVLGGFQLVASALRDEPRIRDAFRGGGMAWGEHHPDLFAGTERFFRGGYALNLVSNWIPALDGVQAKLEAGAMVADVGCGHGASTVILARAYPHSRFFGFDSHAPSIERAHQAAEEAGVGDRASFAVADAADYPGSGYDLVTYFDALHDLGNPLVAARHARASLAPDGAALIVEPMAGERIEDNLNPVGRIFSAGSAMICTPHAEASGGGGLGALATEAEIGHVLRAAGFSRVRRAAETPFNRVFEARP
jgi:SAM-dependent methyltransferase